MKLSQMLQLDCTVDANKQKIQQMLKRIKPLSKFKNDVPFEYLEKTIKRLGERTKIVVGSIVPDIDSNSKIIIWRCEIVNLKNFNLVVSVYGCSLYEVLAKTIIVLYSKAKVNR